MSQKIKVFLDLDGVVVDLYRGLKEKFDFEFPKEQSEDNRKIIHNMWYDIAHNHPMFWRNLPAIPNYMRIYDAVMAVDPNAYICSATPEPFTGIEEHGCAVEKRAWVFEHFGWEQAQRTIITKSKLKQTFIDPNAICILVDDHPGNIKRWSIAGGITIHHTDVFKTVQELSKWK